MGVYIKGMEMPKQCGDCQFCHTEDFESWCCYTGREDILFDAIPEWCPLTEVAEPHGRLIDADALVDTVYYTNISESVKEFIADLIEIAPTVIEAEERKGGGQC